jgi:hypothetical protein
VVAVKRRKDKRTEMKLTGLAFGNVKITDTSVTASAVLTVYFPYIDFDDRREQLNLVLFSSATLF